MQVHAQQQGKQTYAYIYSYMYVHMFTYWYTYNCSQLHPILLNTHRKGPAHENVLAGRIRGSRERRVLEVWEGQAIGLLPHDHLVDSLQNEKFEGARAS